MTDTQSRILGAGSAIAGLLAYTFYKFYKGRVETASQVKGIPVWQPDLDLYDHLSGLEDQTLGYAAVEGVIKELSRTLRSHYGPEEGVIMKSTLVEHKSKRSNGFWSDVKRELRNNTNSVPFALTKPESGNPSFKIEVIDPLSASHIEDAFEVTYDRFEPHKASLMEVGLDRLFGESTKGIQETETMLLTGSSLMGIGKVILNRGKIRLMPPLDNEHAYIITKMSVTDLVRHYESQSKIFKIMAILSALIGGGMFFYLIWKKAKTWLQRRKEQREFEEIRRTLTTAPRNEDGDTLEENGENTCVVCLANRRQVIVLPCGHIAMCADCGEALPQPKKCPVCRALIDNFMPVYYA